MSYNTNQATDWGINQWDNGYPLGGNYWSDFDETGEGAYDDYQGANQDILGSDGIVDLGLPAGGTNPYPNIGGGAGTQDNYPLINPSVLGFDWRLKPGFNLVSVPMNPIFRQGSNNFFDAQDALEWVNIYLVLLKNYF